MMNFNDEIFKNLCVVSAPSGAGKTSLIKKISKKNNIIVSISQTTRKPRVGEKDGEDYFFVDNEVFQENIKKEAYLEYAFVHENYYGTLIDSVVNLIEKNFLVILEIDFQGAEIIKQKLPSSRNIFILPPSLSELEKRLRDRGTDEEDVILRRLENAKLEISMAKNYDYIIVNDDFSRAEEKLLKFISDKDMVIQEEIRKEPLIDNDF